VDFDTFSERYLAQAGAIEAGDRNDKAQLEVLGTKLLAIQTTIGFCIPIIDTSLLEHVEQSDGRV
jgi:hypothetical protein